MRKLVVLGLDGLEPALLERYWTEGGCPNLRALRDSGGYRHLGTTTPAESPVAWSSFITGQNPGRHGIFDFLHRDPRTYLPILSIANSRGPTRSLEFGPWRLPLSAAQIRRGRDGIPFWHAIAASGVPVTIVRVPVTYPPEPFRGRLLASMGIPDLHGTQGSYQYWTTDPARAGPGHGGDAVLVQWQGDTADLPFRPIADPFRVDARPVTIVASARRSADALVVTCDGKSVALKAGEWSPWQRVVYRFSLAGRAAGWVRWHLRSLAPELQLYCSPVNIDPDRPAAPLSHPHRYAAELKRALGPYATLGMAEDTWVLNEQRMDEDAFIVHCQQLLDERTRMLDFELARFNGGLLVCVYDQPDRMQHMFWRFEDEHHPAHDRANAHRYRHVLRDLYTQLDSVVKRIVTAHPDATLIVMSDHGCKPYRRSFHVNRWLAQQGWLRPRDGASAEAIHLEGVDLDHTSAYAMGLVGIFINLRGRERRGTVAVGAAAESIKTEIASQLEALLDPQSRERVVNRVLTREQAFRGRHLPDAPDLVLAYNAGFRASWQTAVGAVPRSVLEDNLLAWSGDHCIDSRLVPGVLLANRLLGAPSPHIMDVAPSALAFFGCTPDPAHEGQPFWKDTPCMT